ncbi:MAG: acylase [Alphaproteobacteria bacterium]
MRRILTGVAGLVAIVLVCAGVYLWSPLPAHPDPAPYREAAKAYDVEIIRDAWGIPHVFGERDRDTVFGLAYAHAEDDFQTIQDSVAATRGVLARYKGVDAAATDYLVALLQVRETALKGLADGPSGEVLSEDAKAIARAYADGLNLYAADHLDETWRGLLPFTAEDLISGFVLRTPLFYGLDGVFVSLFTGQGARELARAPGTDGSSLTVQPTDMAPEGSNAFALSSDRSTDGKTHLVVNSHQPLDGPVAWYEAHLVSKEGLDIYGGLFPGTPLILHGFNRDLGWAATVNRPDLVDVYALVTDPKRDDQYRLDGQWLDYEVQDATIEIRLFGPFAFTATRPVKRSRHGPVIETDKGAFAVRYAGMGEARQLDQYLGINKASTRAEWLQAMARQAFPSINYIYADKTGAVGYLHNGLFPDRLEGWDWTKDLPGDRSDLIWQGFKPFDAVPKLFDPVSGFVFNANNTPFSATDGPDNLKPEDFSATMGLQTGETNRSLRIQELVTPDTVLNGPALSAVKYDKGFAEGSTAVRTVRAILAEDWSGEPDLAAAARHLADWDFQTNKDSTHAALGVLSTLYAVTEPLTGRPAPAPADAFREAVAWLEQHHGRFDPSWGAVNRIKRGTIDLPLSGGPDILRAAYPARIQDDGRLYIAAGDTLVIFVEWDEDGTVSARSVHPYGSATLDATSPHYADQTPLFAAEDMRPVKLDRADILDGHTARYRPGAR